MERIVLPGRPHPLGATWDGTGVNFALYSENATRVELCLYDNRTRREVDRIARSGADGFRLALLRSRTSARPALWLSRAWPLGPRRGPAVQSGQAADRSLCASYQRPHRLGEADLPLPHGGRQRRPAHRSSRQRCWHAEVGSGQSLFRLGARPAAKDSARRLGDLRDARARLQQARSPDSRSSFAAPTPP